MGRTKDESFMLRLYEEALRRGNVEEPMDRYLIGQSVGLQKTATDTICKLLGQANFIKKRGDVDIYITPQGIRLVQQLTNKES